MRSLTILPCLLVSVLASGCTDDRAGYPTSPPVAAAQLTAAAQSAAAAERPYGGACRTAFTFVSPTRLQMEYTCQLQHLGRTTAVATQDLAFGPGGIAITNNTVYTAANGDRLYAQFTGTGTTSADSPGMVSFTGIETYDGGTGRFEHAAGSAELVGTATIAGPGGSGAFSVDGKLTY